MKLTALVLSLLVTATAASEPSFKDFDLFNADERLNAQNLILAEADASTGSSRSFGNDTDVAEAGDVKGLAGSRCNAADTEDGCLGELSCMAGFCLPAGESCYATAITNFTENFDSQEWIANIFLGANITEDELMDAAIASDGYQDFQKSVLFRSLMDVAESSTPDAAYDVQAALDLCDARANDNAPTTQGRVLYLGLHIEISAIFDIALSIFWGIGDVAEPRGWIRGTFGLEAGVGAEVSLLIGLAYTTTTADIEGGSVVIDIDAGLGPHGGLALINNLNGLFSVEFTVGVGAGVGVGVGIGIASPLNDSPRWIFATENQSCEAACSQANLPACNAGQQNTVDTAEKMLFVANQAGRPCTSPIVVACGFSLGADREACPMNRGPILGCAYSGSTTSTCDSTPGLFSNRVCCCSLQDENCQTS